MLLPTYFPAFFTSGCCIIGAILNELRSIPVSDHIAEAALFLLYSGVLIRRGNNNSQDSTPGQDNRGDGIAGALAASLILFLFSLPRLNKGPVPTALFASTVAYYAYFAVLTFGSDDSATGISQDPTAGSGSAAFVGS